MSAKRVFGLFLLVSIALAGCAPLAQPQVTTSAATGEASVEPTVASDAGADAGAATGLLRIMLTDAPPDPNVEKVMVTISTVRVHRAGQGEEAEEVETEDEEVEVVEEDGEESEAGWFTVTEAPQTFDLIALRDAAALLASAELQPGRYTQIRLVVADAVATIDGTEYTLQVPSGTLKLVHPFTITAGQTTVLTLDFDAEASIHAAGNRYKLRPTIRAIGGLPVP